MPVRECEAGVCARPHLASGDDVEHSGGGHPTGMVQGHTVGHPPTTVVAGDREALVPEHRHGLEFAWVSGVESEARLGICRTSSTADPAHARIEDLPTAQQSALGSALGLHRGPAANVFLIGQAVLTILADAAQSRPLICVIDDAHRLDQESLEVLAFVARRVFVEQVGVVFSVREPPRNRLLEGIADLTVAGLEGHEAAALLSAITAGPVDSAVAEQLASLVDGNPLALTEIGRQLGEGRLAPDGLLNGLIPLGRRLEE